MPEAFQCGRYNHPPLHTLNIGLFGVLRLACIPGDWALSGNLFVPSPPNAAGKWHTWSALIRDPSLFGENKRNPPGPYYPAHNVPLPTMREGFLFVGDSWFTMYEY